MRKKKKKRSRSRSSTREQAKRSRATSKPKLVQDIRGRAQWEAYVLESDKPVVVDFWAPWCAPCRTMAPILENVATAYQDSVKFAKVDTQSNPEIARALNIRSIPTLIVFHQGQVSDVSVGLTPADRLHRMIRRVLDTHEGVGFLQRMRRL